MGFWDRFSTDIGVDLGTCNTLIYVRGQGIVVNEPSVVAIERGTKRVMAVGAEAKRMLWKTPSDIIAIRPMADGVIADMDSTEKMIRYFVSRIIKKRHLLRSTRMKIGIPTCITEVEKRAVLEAAYKAGAKDVSVIEESLAAAIGAQIPIHEPAGHMVCDIGGGTTEVSVISLGGMVVTSAIRLGGDKFDEAIIRDVRNMHNLIIGQQTAERLKIAIGNAVSDEEVKKVEIKGTDAITGLPRRLEVASSEVQEALKEPSYQIVEEIKRTLGKTPPELAADIIERGIVMTGGGSLLKGLPKLISQETGVPVILVEHPLDCVAIGAGQAFELYKDIDSDRSIYASLSN
ncbi:rod shape-determining protein [Treponema endosymbiont of Eucomonympha sp.]|uniref:rod shape-determining protein n=1 Tax=Treponema endosymbiont of Eucomonympha sp. TaxID=1580831 RepID=UPI000AD4B3C4|nr:rod shape-determining protein [Treponema endosymbiont of Eucomonympha sp.]